MASRICNVAEFYQKLSAFFRSIGQTRLADTLERVYAFLSQIGNCEPAIPVPLSSARATEALTMADIEAALELAKTLANVTS